MMLKTIFSIIYNYGMNIEKLLGYFVMCKKQNDFSICFP